MKLLHFLFNWKIRIGWWDDVRWKALTHKETLNNYPTMVPPKFLWLRKRWYWYYVDQPMETRSNKLPTIAYRRMQVVNSVCENKW